ncbi:MAG: Nramp family divalent metal transporter [Verrucomicrobiota bacterium]|nr:Nramp family divalent metal transporter [Verrucomicrobiota bacterium]
MSTCRTPLDALTSRNPASWLTIFGPGAIIASLTIGSGELIFSSRGGSIFGYQLLSLFLLVCVFKWVLVFTTARHMILTGAHPIQRWMDLPGPRGWLPMAFLLLAIVSFPIWVSFHSGTLGTLASGLLHPQTSGTGTHLLWGMVILLAVIGLTLTGGYKRLEKLQLLFVLLMLLAVTVSLFLVHPEWVDLLAGFANVAPPVYPEWVAEHPDIAKRPVWVELSTYVGVIGGSGYDYLAYVTYLRDKQWGLASNEQPTPVPVDVHDEAARVRMRQWCRAPLIDCTLSFAIVLLFSAVFVACGTEILGPAHKVPDGNNLLNLQAEFVEVTSQWLRPFYFVGAFLAMFGTLYGTIEVAPAVMREIQNAFPRSATGVDPAKTRRITILWVGIGGMLVLVGNLGWQHFTGADKPTALIAILTPANLFTGVLACGIICILSCWADRCHLKRSFKTPLPLILLNLVAAVLFIALGIKAYWDHSGWTAFLILACTIAAAWFVAGVINSCLAKRGSNG